MNKLKKILAKQFATFYYFYGYLGYRIFLVFFLSILVGALDGLGLSMFLPLLQMVGGAENVAPNTLGKLSFLVTGIQNIGINFNLTTVLSFMLLFFFFKGIFAFTSRSYGVFLLQRFIKQLRLNTLNALNKVDFKFFITSDSGRIQNTMSGEIEKIAVGYNFYMKTFQEAIMVGVYMSFAFFVDFQFAILVTFGGLLTNILYSFLFKRTKAASRKLSQDSNLYQGLIIQHVANFKYLRATGLIKKYAQNLKNTIQKIEQSRRKIGILNAILGASREPILIVVIVLVILIQINLLGGKLGGILISLIFFYRALSSVTALQNAWNRYIGNIGSFENIKNLQKNLDNNQTPKRNEIIKDFPIKLNLDNVNFYYANKLILKDIKLEIKPKQTTAFVGESGSGKTTLVNILAGLLPVDQGTFYIGNKDAKNVEMQSYQNHIGYITQEPVIFNDTIFNNVTFWGSPNAENIEKFWKIVSQASLDDFIEGLKDKEHTQLGNNGINLSGGQRQRLAIARELFKDIEILIMDEATSALDSETEKHIQNSIDALKGKYTILIVAHRLSTIKNADQIVLMNKGKIDKIDTFEKLIKQQENFKKMAKLQEVK